MSNGKGSRRRPSEIDTQTYEQNWDRIFKKNTQREKVDDGYNDTPITATEEDDGRGR